MTEEVEGIESCVIRLHNLIHLPEDIKRFSGLDNYWCFVWERAVHHYVEKSSNKKKLELTFAKSESRRELLKFMNPNSSQSGAAVCEHKNGCLEQLRLLCDACVYCATGQRKLYINF